MKKVFLHVALGIITFNFNLYSIHQEHSEKKEIKQQQLTRAELAKIGAACFGCAFFTAALLTTYHTYRFIHDLPKKERNSFNKPLFCYLSGAVVSPLNSILDQFPHWKKSLKESTGFCSCFTIYILAAKLSGILAGTLGIYVYKRTSAIKSAMSILYKSNNSKSDKEYDQIETSPDLPI